MIMIPRIIPPKERKIVLDNFASLSALQAVNYLLPVITLPYLIRVIGPEKFGLIAFAQALVQYFMILTDYGFNLSATRKISLCLEEHHEKSCAIFSSVITVKLILAAISLFILLILVNFVQRFKQDSIIYLLSFGTVIGNTLFPIWFFQGKEKMIYISRINIVCGLIYTICIFIFVKTPGDYFFVPLLYSLFFLIAGITGLYIAFRKFRLKFKFQKYIDIHKELISGWNIFISVVAINAYTTTRVFAVGLLTNNILTGYYSIAERMANVIQSFPLESLSQALYPRMNKIFARNKRLAVHLINKIQKNTMLAYFLILPPIFLGAPSIVNLLCGANYSKVVVIFRLLLPSVFFVGANAFRIQFLLVSGRAHTYSGLHIFAALIGLPLIFFFIYRFSYLGAAMSTIIIEAGVVISTFIINKRYLNKFNTGLNHDLSI